MNISKEKTVASVEPRSSKHRNTNEILINHVFSVSSIVRKLNENEENHEIQKSIWRYYSNENGDFHEMNEAWT